MWTLHIAWKDEHQWSRDNALWSNKINSFHQPSALICAGLIPVLVFVALNAHRIHPPSSTFAWLGWLASQAPASCNIILGSRPSGKAQGLWFTLLPPSGSRVSSSDTGQRPRAFQSCTPSKNRCQLLWSWLRVIHSKHVNWVCVVYGLCS